MTISKQDALQALRDVDTATQRTHTLLGYRNAAPYCLLWGCIRFSANLVTEFVPALTRDIWNLLTVVGIAWSLWLPVRG
jgi:hypothetical protein